MKKLILALLVVLAMCSLVFAETYTFPDQKDSRKIEVKQDKEFLEVICYPKGQKPILYRVYPCGRIEKMEFREIAPNVENSGVIRWGPSQTLEYYYGNGSLLYTIDGNVRVK